LPSPLPNLTSTAPGRVTTADPTVAAVLARIRNSVGTQGTITPVIGATTLTRENFNFSPTGSDLRKFLALRFDVNIGKKNSVEFVTNRQKFVPSKDFLNSQDEIFPGFPFYTQGSDRNTVTAALRSTLGQKVVNEFRWAHSYGLSSFSPGIAASDFDYSGGYSLGIGTSGATLPIRVTRTVLVIRRQPIFRIRSLGWRVRIHLTLADHTAVSA